MTERHYVVVPGVTVNESEWGYLLGGKRDALIASGLVEPEWFPDGVQCNKRGKIIDRRITLVGGRPVDVHAWTRDDEWLVRVDIALKNAAQRTRADKMRRDYDGRTPVAWSECAWQPQAAKDEAPVYLSLPSLLNVPRRKHRPKGGKP